MATTVGMPIKEKLRLELNKLQKLTVREKVEYVWDYYKFYIIGFILALLLIIGLLNIWFINPAPDTALFISWNSGVATEEQLDELKDVLEALLIDDSENKEVIISYILSNSADPTFEMANLQRLVAMVSAGVIDIFIIDAQTLGQKAAGGFLSPLESILDDIQLINPEVYGIIEENTTYELFEHTHDVFSERIMGIEISSSPLLAKLGFNNQKLYLAVSATSNNTENTVKTLMALF